MALILGGLITDLLLAIYCHEKHSEKVNNTQANELRITIRNELAELLGNVNGGGDKSQDDGTDSTGPS